MGATYTRQSSSAIVDGGIIEAADINAEFNQILAAFAVSSGHTHDGTDAEGGPITKLLGTAITIGDGTAGTDIAVTFDGETGDGVLTWMEDEDYFQFSVDLLLTTTEKLQFRDTAIYINSSADGQLDLVADTEIQIAATTIDINGAVALNGAITGATNITLSGELDAATLDISGDADIDGTLETDALSINGTAVTSTAAELNLVDGITAGTVSASLAVIVDSNKDISGFRNVTLTGELDAATLDISGDADIDGTLEADAITVNGATLTEFITDAVGGMVSSNTETGITVTFEDGDNTLDFALGSSQTTISSLTNTSLVIGRDADNDIDFATDNNIIFRAAGADQIKLVDGALAPVTDNDIDLGTSSLEFKDGFFDGTVTADAFAGPLTGDVTGNVSGTAATVTGAAQSNITSLGTLTTLTVDNVIINGTTIGHTSDTDLITLADGVATVAGEISVTTLDIGGTNVSATATELNLIDGGATIGTDAIADGDGIIHNDGGTMKVTSAATFKTYFTSGVSSAADDLTAGDAAVNITTTSGNITIDAQADDSDIIFKGTDGGVDTTFLTIDGSDAGTAVFNHDIKLPDAGKAIFGGGSDLQIYHDGSNSYITDTGTGALFLNSDGTKVAVHASGEKLGEFNLNGSVDLYHDNSKKFETTSSGVTITGALTTDAGGISLAALDIDGGTDIGADLVDADLFIVDDGAGGTNRKVAASRIKTYIGGGTQWQAVKTGNYTAAAGQGVFVNTTSSAITITLPAGTLGDEVTIVDYAGTFDSNALTVAADGSEKIFGSTDDLTVSTERAAFTLVFTDSTQGWLFKND